MALSLVWWPTSRSFSTSSSPLVSSLRSKLHWPWAVLQVWCCRWVWRWTQTYWFTNVRKKNSALARTSNKHLLTVMATPSLRFSTLTSRLSSLRLSSTTSVQVPSVVLPWRSPSVLWPHSSPQFGSLALLTNTSLTKTSGSVSPSQLVFLRNSSPTPILVSWRWLQRRTSSWQFW